VYLLGKAKGSALLENVPIATITDHVTEGEQKRCWPMPVYAGKDRQRRTITTVIAPSVEGAKHEIWRKLSVQLSLNNIQEWVANGQVVEEATYDPYQKELDELEIMIGPHWQ
jgi:hypothetical protein